MCVCPLVIRRATKADVSIATTIILMCVTVSVFWLNVIFLDGFMAFFIIGPESLNNNNNTFCEVRGDSPFPFF